MAAFTDFAENKLIDFFFRGQALGITGASAAAGTGPVTLYVALQTSPASDATAGTECVGSGYTRVAVTSSLANWAGTQGATTAVASTGTSGTTSNNIAITFPAPAPTGTTWGVIQGVEVYDALTGGNALFYGALGTNKTVNLGDAAPYFAISSLSFQIDN